MAIPNIPNGISKIEREEYNRIKPYLEEAKLTELDRASLLGYLSAYRLMIQAACNLEEYGYFLTVGEKGYQQISPHLTAFKTSSEIMLRYLKSLGFDKARINEDNEVLLSDEEL